MDHNKTTLERAFELASSGRLSDVREIRKQLKLERYDVRQISGRVLTKQLGEVIRNAKAGVDRPSPA